MAASQDIAGLPGPTTCTRVLIKVMDRPINKRVLDYRDPKLLVTQHRVGTMHGMVLPFQKELESA